MIKPKHLICKQIIKIFNKKIKIKLIINNSLIIFKLEIIKI